LHGACDYSAAFDELGPVLAAKGIAALTYDQRGFGTRRSRGRSLEPAYQLSDVKIACDTLRAKLSEFCGGDDGLAQPFILGESMGGGVAVRAAAAGLDIAGLVLVSPASLANFYRRFAFQIAANMVTFLIPWSHWYIERRVESELSDAAAIRLLSDPLVLRRVPSRMIAQLLSLAAEAAQDAIRIRVPTLTLLGTDEKIVHRGCVNAMVDRFDGHKELAIVPGGTHFLIHERNNERLFDLTANWILKRAAR
jgi:alpha-beta hydrolase superfamily lysophospholipase